jgi:hypothetical protein
MKSGNFNFLELSGPLQACNGIALPLPFSDYHKSVVYEGFTVRICLSPTVQNKKYKEIFYNMISHSREGGNRANTL